MLPLLYSIFTFPFIQIDLYGKWSTQLKRLIASNPEQKIYIIYIQNMLDNYIILTHWGRVTHRCVSRLTTIGSDNGLSPGRRQAIIWNSVGILLIEPLWTNFSEILIEIHTPSFKIMQLKMSSGKWRSFCLGLNVLNRASYHWYIASKLYLLLILIFLWLCYDMIDNNVF